MRKVLMKEVILHNDARVKESASAGYYRQVCHDVVKELSGRERKLTSWTIGFKLFMMWSYRKDAKDVEIQITLDLKAAKIHYAEYVDSIYLRTTTKQISAV